MTCFFEHLNHGCCRGPVERGYCAGHRLQSEWRARWDTQDRKPRKYEFVGNGPANQGQSFKKAAA